MSRIKIVTFVPLENAEDVRQALGEAGAGKIGNYSFCSYSVIGKGRFMPNSDAHPHVGTAEVAEVVEEERIEVVCDRSDAKEVITALRRTHPYEEIAFDIIELLDESEL